MSQNYYIPGPDAQFYPWAQEFCAFATSEQVALGLTVGEVDAANAALGEFGVAWDGLDTARNAAKGATQTKDETRDALETAIRAIAQKVQNLSTTTDVQRAGMGITIPDTTPTPLAPNIVLLTPPPVIEVTCHAPQTTTVKWRPAAGSESDALPQGIDGISIWVAVKATDGTLGSWQWVALDTNSPYVHTVGNTTTKTHVYRGQWFDRLKRFGPFGDAVEVAVTA